MTLRIVHGLVMVLIVALLAAVQPAWAGPPTEQLRGHVERVIKVLEDPELKREGRQAERREAIRHLANEIFDFTETTRRSLGQHWQTRTPAEREQFVKLYADVLERSYIGKIEHYSGERIVFVGESVEREQATVRTRLVTKAAVSGPLSLVNITSVLSATPFRASTARISACDMRSSSVSNSTTRFTLPMPVK